MLRLVLLRHGQSLWNREGRFTGWRDVDLSSKGAEEARDAGKILKSRGYTFDEAYTSVLKRAIRTLWLVLDEMDLMWIPTYACWQLNERCYGSLEGRSKQEIEKIYGVKQVHRWRRGFRDMPPALEEEDSRYLLDPKYRRLRRDQIPKTESLEDTLIRLLPCWNNGIAPQLRKGKSIFIVAHGNTLRAVVKQLDGLSEEEIENVEIPTGIPLVYELDEDLLPIVHFFLQAIE
jgi:2,3-bisphosphoglycerate-dependent phosphoglycerate mutase